MMIKIIQISQVVVAILMTVAILLQSRGSSLSVLFGGNDSVYRTKRGAEKILFIATIVLAVLFFGLSIAGLMSHKF